MAAVIGALRAELSATIAKFQEDMGKAAASVKAFAASAEKQGRRLQSVGRTMSLAITAPIVAFGIKSVQAAKESAQALGQVDAALKSTEFQAGRTIKQLQASAKSLETLSTFDDDDILLQVTANLLKFGNVVGDVFDKAQTAIVNMAARTGDLGSATQTIGRALNDPIAGITALTRAGVQFTTQEKTMIKDMVVHRRGIEAQAVILAKLEKAYGGAAAAQRAASPTAAMNQQWRDLMETVGAIVLNVLPPFLSALQGIAQAFNSLSPFMQTVIVGSLAFAAALGPLTFLLGSIMRVVATLTPIIAGLAAGIATITIATWAWVAAIVAVVAALVIFWRSVKDLLSGDFEKAWEDAKKTARDMWADLTSMFAKKPIQAPIELTGLDGKPLKPGATNFNIPKDTDSGSRTVPESVTVTDAQRLDQDLWRGFNQDTADALRFDAEQIASAIRARREVVLGQEELANLRQQRGDAGVMTFEERRRESIARDLEFRTIDAEERLADLRAQAREAETAHHAQALADINDQIVLQEQLATLLKETTVEQIRDAERLQDVFENFFDDVTNEFMRMAKEGKFTFDGLREAIRDMLFDAFVKPHIEQAGGILKTIVGVGLNAIGGAVGGWLGGVLAPTATQAPNGDWIPGPGGFPEPKKNATGGFVPPGQWEIAGDAGPELIFGGRKGVQVFSNEDSRGMLGGGTTINQNINVHTQDASSFMRTERQVARQARRSLQGA